VCFDPKGEFLSKFTDGNIPSTTAWICTCEGVGFTDGTLQVLDAITLDDICPSFRYSRDAVTKIAFSDDSTLMATAVSSGMYHYVNLDVKIGCRAKGLLKP
jgi:hypothetical protein